MEPTFSHVLARGSKPVPPLSTTQITRMNHGYHQPLVTESATMAPVGDDPVVLITILMITTNKH